MEIINSDKIALEGKWLYALTTDMDMDKTSDGIKIASGTNCKAEWEVVVLTLGLVQSVANLIGVPVIKLLDEIKRWVTYDDGREPH